MKKILPIKYPDINAFPHYANLLSILSTERELMMPWVLNNFLQLQFRKYNGVRLDFNICLDYYMIKNNCPWLYKDGLSRDMIYKKWGCLKDFIIDSINESYYVDIVIDEYYISAYDAFQKYYFEHNLMIYGYDIDKKVFYAADNFKNGIYSYETVSFDEIEKSALTKNYYKYCESVILYKKADHPTSHNFSIGTLKNYIYDYLNSLNSNYRNAIFNDSSLERHAHAYEFGLNIYKELIDYINNTDYIIHQIPCVLRDHKKIMLMLCEYIILNKYLYDDQDYINKLKLLYDKSNVIVNLSIKYNLTKDYKIKEKICKLLSDIMQDEEVIYKQIYDNVYIAPHFFPKYKNLLQNSSCEYLGIDDNTSGNWKGVLGKKGFLTPEIRQIDDEIECFIQTEDTFIAENKTSDQRALQSLSSEVRTASCFCKSNYLDIYLLSEYTQVSLYLLDWNLLSISAKICIYDDNDQLIRSDYIENLQNGKYVKYKVCGFIKFRIQQITSFDCIPFGEIFGIFFD